MNLTEQLEQLAKKWMQSSKRRFNMAEQEPNMMGGKLMEHGAVCYFNCATELNDIIKSMENPS